MVAIPTPITRLSDKNSANTSITGITNPTFVGGETMAISHTLSNGDIVYMNTTQGDNRDGGHLFDGNTTGGWGYASHGNYVSSPMTWAYKFTSSKKYVNQMKFWQTPNGHPSGDINISYYDESTTTWKNVTSPDKTGFNTSVAPVYAESITINFDATISDYWKITAYSHPSSPSPTATGLYEWEIYGSDDIMTHLAPYATISEVANIAENDLTLVSGSVFSSITSITKYYVVAFVTSAPSGSVVDTSTIDETTIATFITNLGALAVTGYKTLFGATGNNMYYNEDGVAQYEVETIENITVASAFRTLTPTTMDGSEMVDITTTSGYSFDMYTIALDSIGNYGFGIFTTKARWWRIEYGIAVTSDIYYYSRILELGLLDEITPSLPSTGSTVSRISRTTNLKDIYVWTRLQKTGVAHPAIPYLYDQVNINGTFDTDAVHATIIPSIFNGSTSTSQISLFGYNVTSSYDASAKVRFDYEFFNPTEALQIVFTDGNDQTNGYQGGITSMQIYKSYTGAKNDNAWELHSSFDNFNNPDVIADPNTSSNGWDLKYAPKGLKVIQYNDTTKAWEYKGIFQVS
jgi:hypothetical protein